MKKTITTVACIATGVIGAASVRGWPEYATQIQMVLYTVMVLGLLFIGLWSERGRAKFRTGLCLLVLLHLLVLASMRSLFPFKTILVVIPVAIVEAIIGATLFLRLVGY
jgi:hypothetical protein